MPVASVIVTLLDVPVAPNVPLVMVTSLTRIRRPSSASPTPSASCDSVTTCGAGAVPVPRNDTLVTVSSVRPLNCVTVPVASTLSPMLNGPGVERRAEQIDAAGRVLDVVLDAVPAAEIDRGDRAADLDDVVQEIGNRSRAGGVAVGVGDGVDPRVGDASAAAAAAARSRRDRRRCAARRCSRCRTAAGSRPAERCRPAVNVAPGMKPSTSVS